MQELLWHIWQAIGWNGISAISALIAAVAASISAIAAWRIMLDARRQKPTLPSPQLQIKPPKKPQGNRNRKKRKS